MGVSLHDNIERRILCFNIYIIRVVLRYGRFANLETAGTMTMLYAVCCWPVGSYQERRGDNQPGSLDVETR